MRREYQVTQYWPMEGDESHVHFFSDDSTEAWDYYISKLQTHEGKVRIRSREVGEWHEEGEGTGKISMGDAVEIAWKHTHPDGPPMPSDVPVILMELVAKLAEREKQEKEK